MEPKNEVFDNDHVGFSGSVSASGPECLAEVAGRGQFDPKAVTFFSPGTKGAWSIHI